MERAARDSGMRWMRVTGRKGWDRHLGQVGWVKVGEDLVKDIANGHENKTVQKNDPWAPAQPYILKGLEQSGQSLTSSSPR
jgi:hypothetical protein